jgi:hypothetical protein
MAGKIITPQQAKAEEQRPWLKDLQGMALQLVSNVEQNITRAMAINRLEMMLMKTDFLVRLGEFDEAFVTSAHAMQNPACNFSTIKMIIDMWSKIKDELSADFVNHNEVLCESVIKGLNSIKNKNGIKQKKCNLIIQRLSEKQEVSDVEK